MTANRLNDTKLIKRSMRVAFADVGTREQPVYVKMQGFSSMSESKSPKEYSRQYVDEDVERSDVVGYATQIGYSFDRHSPYSVHEKIADITDNEKTGSDAQTDIVTVDLFTEGAAKVARKRAYSIIPDTTGDGTDALIYSGNFRAAGDIVMGTAVSDDNWQTITFMADEKQETGVLSVTSAAGTVSGETKLTVTPARESGNTYRYKTGTGLAVPEYDADCTGMTEWDGTSGIAAVTDQKILVVECAGGRARKAGTATVTSKV